MVLFLNAKIIAEIPEASGICFCESSKTLFVANDEGYIYEINKKGDILRKKFLGKHDLEGVTCDKNFLYFIDERNILLKISYNFELLEKIEIKDIKKSKKSGLEGITKYKNYFYVSQQKSKYIFLIDKNGKLIEKTYIGIKDISGIDIHNDILYIISDKNNILIKYNVKTKKIVKKVKLPKFAQEGIAITKNNLFFADDNGRILKLKMEKICN
jgi:uncharacterized protein YjiK